MASSATLIPPLAAHPSSLSARPESRPARGRELLGFSARESQSHHAARSKSPAPSESPPVHQSLSLQTVPPAKDLRSESIPPPGHPLPTGSNNRADSRPFPERTPPSKPYRVPAQPRLQSAPQLASD